jgi:hypothetical protein
VWHVDQNAEGNEVAPVESCSHRTSRNDSLPRSKNTSHRMNRKVYSSLMITSNDMWLPL